MGAAVGEAVGAAVGEAVGEAVGAAVAFAYGSSVEAAAQPIKVMVAATKISPSAAAWRDIRTHGQMYI